MGMRATQPILGTNACKRKSMASRQKMVERKQHEIRNAQDLTEEVSVVLASTRVPRSLAEGY
jgi:hypothetical protein